VGRDGGWRRICLGRRSVYTIRWVLGAVHTNVRQTRLGWTDGVGVCSAGRNLSCGREWFLRPYFPPDSLLVVRKQDSARSCLMKSG
jgi:hypothetical protein